MMPRALTLLPLVALLLLVAHTHAQLQSCSPLPPPIAGALAGGCKSVLASNDSCVYRTAIDYAPPDQALKVRCYNGALIPSTFPPLIRLTCPLPLMPAGVAPPPANAQTNNSSNNITMCAWGGVLLSGLQCSFSLMPGYVASVNTYSCVAGDLQEPEILSNEDAATNAERESVQAHPFLEFHGLLDGSWARFFILAVASSRLAVIFPRIGLPLITGYMIIGCICGPYVLGLIASHQIPDLSYITQTALAFIAFSAGSELYLPELRSLFRSIAVITGMNALFAYVFCSLFIYGLAAGGVVPWMSDYLGSCAVTISMLAGSIMVARSPASAIAVVRELRAKGPVTSIMLGVTVVGDVVVLILFTLSSSFAMAMCGEGGSFEGGAFLVTIITLAFAVVLGYGLGFVLIFLLWLPKVPGKFTIIPLGFIIFVLCDWLAAYSEANWGVTINFDALLICITAGYVVTNQSHNRVEFLKLLGNSSPYIFIPFFTKVGVELKLAILVQSIGFGFLVFLFRGFCIFSASALGARFVGMDKKKQLTLWMTMLAQAGVSLGLASEIANRFVDWGAKFQTTIIAVVLLNQFAGPVCCKYALKLHNEAGKMTDEDEDEHGHDEKKVKSKKRVLMFGVDSAALSVASKLLKQGYRVSFFDADKKKLILAKALGVPKEQVAQQWHDGSSGARTVTAASPTPVASAPPLHSSAAAAFSSSLSDSPAATSDEGLNEAAANYNESETVKLVDAAATSSSPDANSYGVAAPAAAAASHASEPSLDLIQISSDSSLSPLQLYSSYLSTLSSSSVTACVLSLSSDSSSYELGVLLSRVYSFSRVVVRVHNPQWASTLSGQGLLPLFDQSTEANIVWAAACSKPDKLTLQATAHTSSPKLAESVMSLISATEDLNFHTLPMSGDQRVDFDEQHPAPTEEQINNIQNHFISQGLQNVRLLSTVESSQRSSYLEHMDNVHSYEDTVSHSEVQMNQDIFLGVAALAQRDEDAKKKEKQESQ